MVNEKKNEKTEMEQLIKFAEVSEDKTDALIKSIASKEIKLKKDDSVIGKIVHWKDFYKDVQKTNKTTNQPYVDRNVQHFKVTVVSQGIRCFFEAKADGLTMKNLGEYAKFLKEQKKDITKVNTSITPADFEGRKFKLM